MALTFQGVVAAGGISNGGTVVASVIEDAIVGELVVIFVAHDQPGNIPVLNLDCTLLVQVEVAGFALAVFYTVLGSSLLTPTAEITVDLSYADVNADVAMIALHADGVTDGVTAGYRSATGTSTAPATSSHSPPEDTLYLCGVGRDGGAGEFTPGSGWTDTGTEIGAGGLAPFISTEYRSADSGTITGDGALSPSQNWAAVMAFFTDNSGAGSDPADATFSNFLMLM